MRERAHRREHLGALVAEASRRQVTGYWFLIGCVWSGWLCVEPFARVTVFGFRPALLGGEKLR